MKSNARVPFALSKLRLARSQSISYEKVFVAADLKVPERSTCCHNEIQDLGGTPCTEICCRSRRHKQGGTKAGQENRDCSEQCERRIVYGSILKQMNHDFIAKSIVYVAQKYQLQEIFDSLSP